MRRYLLAYSAAGIVALAVGVAAQAPATSTQTQPQSAAAPAQITVEGCLVNEQDVPGRKPNVVEKAGVTTDYIVTNAKMIKGTAPSAAAPSARAGEPVGTSGTSAPMFDVKEIDGSKLKPLVGKRVQIDGTFADLTKSATAAPTEDLVDIKATAIREVPGDCSAK